MTFTTAPSGQCCCGGLTRHPHSCSLTHPPLDGGENNVKKPVGYDEDREITYQSRRSLTRQGIQDKGSDWETDKAWTGHSQGQGK